MKNSANGRSRKIDEAVRRSSRSLTSRFAVISKMEIRAWKAYLILFFVAGFAAAMVFAAYNSWFIRSRAASSTIYTLTANEAHRAGETFQTQILLDSASQNVVAVQAIATFDPTAVSVTSVDTSTTDFPNEVLKKIDAQGNTVFVALGKQTPGVNSGQGKIAVVNLTALKDFYGAGFTLKPVATDLTNSSAAILDDGNGTNILSAVENRFTNPADKSAPALSGGSPTGTLAAGTTSATLKVTTNENATCRYSTTAGTAYASMTNNFSTTGSTSHSTTVSGLSDGNNYKYYVRCIDAAVIPNVNTSDYSISFSVASPAPADTTPPALSGGSPTGTLAAGTTSATLKVTTNENATCRYSTTAGTAYASMTNNFSTTGSTSHSTTVSGLSDGKTFSYYVRCADKVTPTPNVNTGDYAITFSVASAVPSDLTISSVSASSTSNSVTIRWTTNVPGTSQVEYGTTNNFGSQTGINTNLVTSHSVAISGLTPLTTYYYRVKSKDASGKETISSVYKIKTKRAR